MVLPNMPRCGDCVRHPTRRAEKYKFATRDAIEECNTDHQERKTFLVGAITDSACASLLSMSEENLLPVQ